MDTIATVVCIFGAAAIVWRFHGACDNIRDIRDLLQRWENDR